MSIFDNNFIFDLLNMINMHRMVSKINGSFLRAVFVLCLLSYSCIDQPHTRFDHTAVDSSKVNNVSNMLNQAYKGEDRHIWQKPEIVLSLLGDMQDKTIVDIGAGAGYFAFKFVRFAGKVIAVDIDERMIRLMNEEKRIYPDHLRDKFEARLAQANDPLLAKEEADIIFIANTYPYIENRVQYFTNLLKGLKPEGRVMIIDFKMKHTPIGPDIKYRIPLGQVEEEIIQAGYQIIKSDDSSLDYQYILIAQKPSSED